MKLIDDLRNLDRNNVGGWPNSVKIFFISMLHLGGCDIHGGFPPSGARTTHRRPPSALIRISDATTAVEG